MELASLIISLISGAIGGNLTGAAMSQKNLGALGNTIAGLIGGGLGDWIVKGLGLLGTATAAAHAPEAATNLDLASILASIGGGAGGGAILTAIIALLKDSMSGK